MKILVVDDEWGFCSLLSRTLRRLGHETVIAIHPLDAIDLLDSRIDAVITDIDMPEMNGVELAQTIRQRYQHVPIAFCTGSGPDNSVVKVASVIGRVLPKPWTFDELRSAVEELEHRSVYAAHG